MPEREIQEQEKEFRRFITRLLKVQDYNFLKQSDLFSQETLRKTLVNLCDIIAEEIKAESCVIHLKAYNTSELPLLADQVDKYMEDISKRWRMNDQEGSVFSRSFMKDLSSTLCFPYWKYPKGVSRLVAANSEGPWDNNNLKEEDRIGPLYSGITADIFQDNFARIRDPLSIRHSRRLRKLGWVDHVVWQNTDWRKSFKNFYGSPIRIHPAGEVIGTLRVENKHGRTRQKGAAGEVEGGDEVEQGIENILNLTVEEALKVTNGLGRFESEMLKFSQRMASEECRQISLLALAYLVEDLRSAKTKNDGRTLKQMLFVPYADIHDRTKGWSKWSKVVQITTKTIDDERILRKALGGKDVWSNRTYNKVKEFYLALSKAVTLQVDTGISLKLARREICGLLTSEFSNEDGHDTLRHFHYKTTVNKGKDSIDLYIFSPPNRATFWRINEKTFESDCRTCAKDIAELYGSLPGGWTGGNLPKAVEEKFKTERSGEWIYLHARNGPCHTQHCIVDLLVDRWAARIQALNYCAPVREFNTDDTKKLCWAALEIGNLVERQISYRASHSEDPIPLTAMEFNRIPIGDLCFVDDLRKRRDDAQKVHVHIDHHIQNLLHTMHIREAVRYTSRIKGHRSYLARLGERHEGFVRSNLAIWLYLLSLTDLVTTRGSKEADSFPGKLLQFGKQLEGKIVKINGNPLEDSRARPLLLSDAHKRFFEDHGHDVIGDTRFATPPFADYRAKARDRKGLKGFLENLKVRIFKNLLNEGFVRQSGKGDDPTDVIKIGRDAGKRPYAITKRALGDVIFRHYEPYAVASASLLCQAINLSKEFGSRYLDFYEACFRLRNVLAVSRRDIEDTPQFHPLAELFSKKSWADLKEYVETNDTEEFIASIAPEMDDRNPNRSKSAELYLTPRGIYKRIRHLNHTLNQQRGPAHLEWELGRFDLLGCRLTCLYKNQVFAAYEQLWNSGDPFFGMVTERGEGAKRVATEKDFIQDRDRGRQRWLCLRTKHFEGDYYSLQVSGLVDPRAIHEGFWDERGYNLRRVQWLLGRLFEEFDQKGADRYKSLARARQHLRWEYVDWYETAAEVIRNKSVPEEKREDLMVGFGSFVGAAAVELLIEKIDELRMPNSDTTEALSALRKIFASLQSLLTDVVQFGQAYTTEILHQLTSLGPRKVPFEVAANDRLNIDQFFKAVSSLYGTLAGPLTEKLPWRAVIVAEREYYSKQFLGERRKRRIKSATPIIFVPDITPVKTYADEIKKIDLNCDPEMTPATVRALRDLLANLRREQKALLFFRGASDGVPKPGLVLRDEDNVLHRIYNYTLLYDRDSNKDLRKGRHAKNPGQKKEKDDFLFGWTSRGLFYYLRSLVPVELQVRTMLAETLSEQYHDAIYKGAPPKGTDFPRKQMQNIAEELDTIDKEMEIDFEDYINRTYFVKRAEDGCDAENPFDSD